MDHSLELGEHVTPTPRDLRGLFKLRTNVHLAHRRGGVLLEERDLHNLVTSAGQAAVAGLINGVITNAFEHIAIGTGTNAAAIGDTALQTEITTGGGARAPGTTSRVTTDVTNDTAQVVLTFTFSAGFAVTEAGLLDSLSGGVLLARQVFSALNVVSGDSLTLTWRLDVD